MPISESVSIDCYLMPSGEKRIGLTSAAIVCGHKKNYFSRLQSATPKQLEALRGKGFDGYTVPVMIERASAGGKGSARSETLSLDDFRAFVRFSAFDLMKPPAMAIADAMIGIGIETLARQAFGEVALTLAEVRAIICTEYAKTLNWLEEDRADADEIESQQIFIQRGYWPA